MSVTTVNKRTLEIARRHQLLLKAKQFNSVVDLIQWLNTLPVEDRGFLRSIIKQEDVY